jgi:serine O-acetyltransferase
MFEHVRCDLARYRNANLTWYREVGFWTTANYRFGRWGQSKAPAPLRKPLALVHGLLSSPFRHLLAVHLSREADIGEGLMLLHAHDIIIPSGSTLGRGCTIFHDVTLGAGRAEGTPRLGDGVVVFSGARILGGVEIGARAEIGANTVVTRNIPPDAAFCVSPGRVVSGGLLEPIRERREPEP